MLRTDASDWTRSGDWAQGGTAAGRRNTAPPGMDRSKFDATSPDVLVRMVEGEIIPRLLVAHRCATPAGSTVGAPRAVVTDSDINRVASGAMREDARHLLALVDAHLADGVGTGSLLVDLLGPAARRLGEWWEQDVCDFVDVTMGLWRLQEVVHEVTARAPAPPPAAANPRLALFAIMPGEDHAFGSLMVEELFRNAGWATRSTRTGTVSDTLSEVRAHSFDLIALTASSERPPEQFAEFIADLRRLSRNRDVIVMVGGWIFNKDPGLAARIGADGTAADARTAVEVADTLLNAHIGPNRSAAGAN